MTEEKKDFKEVLTRYTPAIFIGLGGSGTTIVSSIKYKALAKFRQLHPVDGEQIVNSAFQFIVADSLEQGPDALGIPAGGYVSLGWFDGQEMVRVKMQDDPDFREWWYPEYSSDFQRAGSAIRINGRLCLLNNLSRPDNIAVAIERACNTVATVFKDNIAAAPGTFPINIYIFNSIAGGTGSGIFIDLAYYIRQKLPSGFAPEVYAYLITPEVIGLVAPAGDMTKFRAHSYAALRELNFWQNPNRGIRYSWKVGAEVVERPESERPFTLVHLFHTSNDRGKTINDFVTIHRLIADIVFYDACLPPSAHQIGQRKADIVLWYSGDEADFHTKPVTFGSAAVATLRFPLEKIATYMATDILPEIIRDRVMKEDADAAKREVVDFLLKKAAVEEKVLKQNITADPDFPRIPLKYRGEIERARRRDLPSVCGGAKSDLERFEANLRAYFAGAGEGEEGKEAKILATFRTALTAWVNYILGQTRDDKVGLLAQSAEKLQNYLEGRLREGSSGSLPAQVGELKKEEKNWREKLERAEEEAFGAGLLSRGSTKELLKEDFEGLFNTVKDRLVLEVTISVYVRALSWVQNLRAAIKFVRKQVVHACWNRLEAQKANWVKVEYDDERGGVVTDVLSKEWADDQLSSSLRKDSAFVAKCGAEVMELCKNDLKEAWNAIEGGTSVDRLVRERQGALQTSFYNAALGEAVNAIRKKYSKMSVWDAIVEEAIFAGARAKEKEKIKLYISRKLNDWGQKAAPWWPVLDSELGFWGLYGAGRVRRCGILLRDGIERQKFAGGDYAVELDQALGLEQGIFGEIESKDPYALQLVAFKYGAPLFLFRPIREYRRAHEIRKKQFPNIPLYTDKRYEEGKEYRLDDPAEPPGELPIRIKKLVFALSEDVILPGEESPRITLDASHTRYTFELPGKALPSVTVRGRDHAQQAWFDDKFRDGKPRYMFFHSDLREYWNNLATEEKEQILRQTHKRIDDWVKKIGSRTEEKTAIQGSLVQVLQEDAEVLREKLDSGNYNIPERPE